MAWTDEPTDAQIRALHGMLKWRVADDLLVPALDYLKETKTRREVSDELIRVRALYHKRKLMKSNCFESSIWNDFKLLNEDEDE